MQKTGEHRNTLTGHTDGIRVAAFSPDGTTLVSASQDYTIRVWDPHIGEIITTLTGNTGPVSALAFSPDGETLASNGAGGMIQLWDTDTWQRQLAIRTHYDSIYTLAFSLDGKNSREWRGLARQRTEDVGCLYWRR